MEGIIRIIDNEPYFEYYTLSDIKEKYIFGIVTGRLKKFFRDHEASKRFIEVGNVFYGELSKKWFYDDEVGWKVNYKVIDNQLCKAFIRDDKAVITELIYKS